MKIVIHKNVSVSTVWLIQMKTDYCTGTERYIEGESS